MGDNKLGKYLILLLLFPLALAMCSGDRYRYPCQDPANWDKDFCKVPICDVNRTCPEHIFKGQRDPRQGPPKDGQTQTIVAAPPVAIASATQGANCAK
jgi:hypothetical protein